MKNITREPWVTKYGYASNPSFMKGEVDKSNRSEIRIHGGRQEEKGTYLPLDNPKLLRTSGCIRVLDGDAKRLYDWWVEYHKINPTIKPGKVQIIKQ